MVQHLIKIKSIKYITHDVLQILTERPQKYDFTPVQAGEIVTNKNGSTDEKIPAALPENDLLEFTIKSYPALNGATNELLQHDKNDVLILHDVFGAIEYKGEGVFIAGGSGVTPFICIFRYLQSKNETDGNKLIFANETNNDVVLALEFKELFGENFINILSDETTGEFAVGEEFLNGNIAGFDQHYYICGPPPMMDSIQKQLKLPGMNKKFNFNQKNIKKSQKTEDHFGLLTSDFRHNLKTPLCETKEQTLK